MDSATRPAAQTGLGWARQAQGPYSPLVDPSQACFSSFSVKQPHEQPPSPFNVASRSRSGKSPLLGLSITSYSFTMARFTSASLILLLPSCGHKKAWLAFWAFLPRRKRGALCMSLFCSHHPP